ncbi:MAG: 4-alpha-glucanotransferase [Erysipelotrichaceae bacterium]|nr:4-alpha-glucanotransferase [Erysipelotrichaceae bacterium]
MKRSSGVLLHISSLPSDYGIGTLGKEAYNFVDTLKKAGQSYWQILPIGPTSFGDSPYTSFSAFAGNPYFIDFDLLAKDKLLKKKEYQSIKWFKKEDEVDYGTLYEKRFDVLRIAVNNFVDNKEYIKFVRENDWLNDYALFMSIKNFFNGCDWLNWPDEYRLAKENTIKKFKRKNKSEIRFWTVIQYFFYKQFKNLKAYANNAGIKIFGDCPIYVAMDSCDVWSNPDLFKINKNKIPTEVAAVPPDYFSNEGQLWGNPIYDWKKHKKDNYSWWINRLNNLSKFYDAIRIDHFIGLDTYYSVDYGSINAVNGNHHKGPGMDFINAINQNVKNVEIIAENLGALTKSMRRLLDSSGYPGMRVFRFGFNGERDNEHLPHTYHKNTVAYITSHDTETCMGWINNSDFIERNYINDYFRISDYNEFNWIAIERLEKCRANLCIVQAQDLLGIGEKGRMNAPATLGGRNWKWRLTKKELNTKIIRKLKKLTEEGKRV